MLCSGIHIQRGFAYDVRMKYVMIFHANLNYAFLEPHKYEQVIRASYEVIIDTFRESCPQARYVFEASGFTIDTIAAVCPDVLAKLKDAVSSGQCEFMGSPYGHPMLSNFPEEDGRWANEFSMRAYEKQLGFRPESGWNPECGWMQYVPRTFRDVGYKYLTLDFESYKISTDPAYAAVERHHDRTLHWGGNLPWYDLSADEPALHFPFANVVPGLGGFCRSDRLAGKAIGYFLGGATLEEFMTNLAAWRGTREDGGLIMVADDAEYCGTTAYFFVKHFSDYSKSFAVDPTARERCPFNIQWVQEHLIRAEECITTIEQTCARQAASRAPCGTRHRMWSSPWAAAATLMPPRRRWPIWHWARSSPILTPISAWPT
jgi:hypothetical protein